MNHPDFRIEGRIFASLGHPDETAAMVKLTPEQQASYIAAAPRVFSPSPGAWGRQGYTRVHLPSADPDFVRPAIESAWENVRQSSKSKSPRRKA